MRARPLIPIVLIAVCLLPSAGCRRKAVKTAPDAAPNPVTAAPAPASEPAPAPEPEMAPAPETDPLAGDLDAVNDYLRRQGLLGDAFFDYDQAELSQEARDQLHRNAQFLSGHPQFLLTLEGHCDERGTTEYNLALGERRAQSARSYMVSLGVPTERLQAISYGKERPVCTDSDEGCWRGAPCRS